jgi:hypothetical protein
MYEFIFVYIVLSLIIIIKIIDFLSETFFPYFFHVHLSILDKVVSSLYAIFGTSCRYRLLKMKVSVAGKTLSASMAAALETMVDCSHIPSEAL